MKILHFQRKLCNRLLAWTFFSLLFGTGMRLDHYDPLKSAGSQFLAWGAIDGLIALFGKRSVKKRLAELGEDGVVSAETSTLESRKLARILWVNTALDVGYVIGGYRLMQRKDNEPEKWQGTGAGIMIQGGFLFLFDLIHALRVPKVKN